MTEQELRDQICLIGQLMHQKKLIDGTSGNISARLDDRHILATPTGLAKGFMSPDQLIILDMEGHRANSATSANVHLQPTSEISMHLECYRQRPDVGGVVHAHPPTAIALTIVGYDLRQLLIPEMIVELGLVPTAPYATPASEEGRDAIRDYIQEHDCIMLAHHGSLTVARTVWNAYARLESLEHCANILYKVALLGGPKGAIPWHQVEKLLAVRDHLGLSRHDDRERFAEVYGLIPAAR